MTSTRARSNGPVLSMKGYEFQRSSSPNGRFASSGSGSMQSSFCSTTSAFSSSSSGFFTRSASPTRVNLYGSAPSAPSVRFSLDRSKSPSRSITGMPVASGRDAFLKKQKPMSSPPPKKTCMCSPTNHPGSFRCSLHKSMGLSSNRLGARRSSMTNSLVRIGSVEGEWVRRALTALIRPSSHSQRRRAAFQPRPSRLSVMSKADDLENEDAQEVHRSLHGARSAGRDVVEPSRPLLSDFVRPMQKKWKARERPLYINYDD